MHVILPPSLSTSEGNNARFSAPYRWQGLLGLFGDDCPEDLDPERHSVTPRLSLPVYCDHVNQDAMKLTGRQFPIPLPLTPYPQGAGNHFPSRIRRFYYVLQSDDDKDHVMR